LKSRLDNVTERL